MDYCGVCGTVLFFLRWMDCEAVLDLFRFIRLDSKWDANSELVVGVEMLVYSQDKSRWTTSYKFLIEFLLSFGSSVLGPLTQLLLCFFDGYYLVCAHKRNSRTERNRHALLDQWKSSTTRQVRFDLCSSTTLGCSHKSPPARLLQSPMRCAETERSRWPSLYKTSC